MDAAEEALAGPTFGLTVTHGANSHLSTGNTAGTGEERAEDINAAISDAAVKLAVIKVSERACDGGAARSC